MLCTLDLIELEGKDLGPARLNSDSNSITLSEHYKADGSTIYKHAPVRLRRIVSKRIGYPTAPVGSTIGSRSRTPASPAVKHEAEENWCSKGWRASSQNMTTARVAERVAALFLLCFVGFGGGIGRIFKIGRQPINANLPA